MKNNEKLFYPIKINNNDRLELLIQEENNLFVSMIYSGINPEEMSSVLDRMKLPRTTEDYFLNCFKILEDRLLDNHNKCKNISIYIEGIPKEKINTSILERYIQAASNFYKGTN